MRLPISVETEAAARFDPERQDETGFRGAYGLTGAVRSDTGAQEVSCNLFAYT